MKIITAKLVLLALFFAFAVIANAQKLPNVQQTSLRVPANLKIDGKATEWDDKFQAYNKATGVFYTIANDDDKLYLTIQATNPQNITKIIMGGITFTITPSDNKKDKNGLAITFPKYDKKNPPVYVILDNKPKSTKDTLKNKMQADSFLNAHNQQLNDKLKLIGVEGVKSITDSVISIYNTEGIKAMALFDNKIYYTYELSVPLKQIGLTVAQQTKFSYNIRVNGPNKGNIRVIERDGYNDILTYTGADGVNYGIGLATPENMTMAYPTDFWGEYTLAKK